MLKCYAAMLPQLLAERQLAAIEAAGVPYMSASASSETVAKYTRLLKATAERPPRATLADLTRMGFNVRTVPKKETSDSG